MLTLAAALAWLAFGSRAASVTDYGAMLVGRPAPNFRLPLLAAGPIAPPALRHWQPGRTVDLREHRGVPVVLEFWATWCAPCIANRPAVVRIASQYANRGVVVYGIPYNEPSGLVLKWLKGHGGAAYPELDDPDGHATRAYLVRGVPQMFLVGPDGQLRWHCFGCDSLATRLPAVIDSVLGSKGLGPDG